jgi:arylsulfatase A-like enzyme
MLETLNRFLSWGAILILAGCAPDAHSAPNIIFVLTDDQRYDELGFLNEEISTPHIDSLAEGGVFFRNAFVTTSLCSPSRASILTGLYAHSHGVVDNLKQNLRPDIVFFPEDLQKAGYQTAFVGKWHMGLHTDDKQPGFDYWVSFAGQGNYLPSENSIINVDGKRIPQKGYITDELTDYAVDWLDARDDSKPFFLYLSHKAVHATFTPAVRHESLYSDIPITMPENSTDTTENYEGKPMWVKNQRNSWHGVDFAYHNDLDIREYKRDYHRAMAAVDDSVGRLLAWLSDNELTDNTIVIFMGDNGFMFGEHGLIDKRNAYEESIRVPMLAFAPGRFPAGTLVDEMVANIDIAPTILELAGINVSREMHGSSLVPLASADDVDQWRSELYYEYFWNWVFPQTPTVFALRTDKYKLIQYHGIWDTDELYDIQNDPKEMVNLIADPAYRERVRQLRKRLHAVNLATGGSPDIRYTVKEGHGLRFRGKGGADQARFPESIFRDPNPPDIEDYKE